MKVESLLFVVLTTSFWSRTVGAKGQCSKLSSCSCKYEDGDVIDLSPLSSSTGPKFQDVQDDQNKDLFSWNPCIAFSEGDCNNVAVCQIQPSVSNPSFYPVGDQDSATFSNNDQGQLTLSYSSEQQGVLRTSYIALICDSSEEGSLSAPGERADLANFDLTLKSKYVCAGGSGLSAGSIILIIFFASIVLVILVGVPFQIFIKKESGIRVLPFSKLITSFPGLVKDGVFFVVRRKKGKSYDTI